MSLTLSLTLASAYGRLIRNNGLIDGGTHFVSGAGWQKGSVSRSIWFWSGDQGATTGGLRVKRLGVCAYAVRGANASAVSVTTKELCIPGFECEIWSNVICRCLLKSVQGHTYGVGAETGALNLGSRKLC